MAHNITIQDDGVVEYAYHGERPWHQLGVKLPDNCTWREAMVIANMMWQVDDHQLYYRVYNKPCQVGSNVDPGSKVDQDNLCQEDANNLYEYRAVDLPHRLLARRDNGYPLAIVKSRYVIVQNEIAFGLCDNIFGSMAKIESIGSLKGGRICFILAKMTTDQLAVKRGDPLEKYFLVTNSFEGQSLRILPTTVRVVCNNTLDVGLRMGEREKNILLIKHVATANQKILNAKNMLEEANTDWETVLNTFKKMAEKPISKDDAWEIVCELVPQKGPLAKARRDAIWSTYHIEIQPQVIPTPLGGGSVYDLFNAITWWNNHERKLASPGSNWLSTIDGAGRKYLEEAQKLCLAKIV